MIWLDMRAVFVASQVLHCALQQVCCVITDTWVSHAYFRSKSQWHVNLVNCYLSYNLGD